MSRENKTLCKNKSLNLQEENLRLKELNVFIEQKLKVIYELTDAINKNYSTKAIIQMLNYSLVSLLKINNVAFIVKAKKWEMLLNYGAKFRIEDIDINKILKANKDSQNFISDEPLLSDFSYIISISHKTEVLGFLLISELSGDLIQCSCKKERYCYITSLVNLTIMALENKKLFRQIKQDNKIQEEIDWAADVQKALIPEVFPKSDYFDFYGKYIPFETVGGDFYDVIVIDEDNIAFCICDVSGKGLSAGMLMSSYQASLRTSFSRGIELKELVISLNKKYYKTRKHDKYVSMFLGTYNLKTRELQYVNAGHNPPILKIGNNLSLLEKGCTIIGILEELPYVEVGSIVLDEDAMLVMYTDGLSEVYNSEGEEYGIKNLKKHLIKYQDEPLEILTNSYITSINHFKGDEEIFDDISLLCARFPLKP